jgi:hypothetical protein
MDSTKSGGGGVSFHARGARGQQFGPASASPFRGKEHPTAPLARLNADLGQAREALIMSCRHFNDVLK